MSIQPPIKGGQEIWRDPRPDLKGDSAAWSRLLTMARRDYGLHVASTLHWFRTMGTRLQTAGERLVLAGEPGAACTWETFNHWPELTDAWRRKIEESGLNGKVCCGWTSLDDYKLAREQWLRPMADKLSDLLKRLAASAEGGMLLRKQASPPSGERRHEQLGKQASLPLGEQRHDGKVTYVL